MSPSAILLALLGLSLALPSAAPKPATCQVTGTIKGLGTKPVVFLYADHNGHEEYDTVQAVNDRFTYTAHPNVDGLFNLKLVPGQYTPIWYEPGNITVTGSMTELDYLQVRGTPDNDALTNYNQLIEERFVRHPSKADSAVDVRLARQQASLAFVRAHPTTRTSAYLLYWQTMYNSKPRAEYQQLLSTLAPAVQASFYGKDIVRRLVILRDLPQVGHPVPAFAMPDTAGAAVSLAQFKGQYVLLDFWGHWCGPCIRAMPHLKELRKHYSRQMTVVGVALENPDDKKLWLQAIRKNQLDWTQLSESPSNIGVTEQYDITAFPTYMLLDQQGVLLVKTNDLNSMEEKLKTLVATP